MSEEVLMDQLIPLTLILIKVGRVPVVLVKLAVCEPGQLGIKVWRKVETGEANEHVGDHHGCNHPWYDFYGWQNSDLLVDWHK